MATNDMNMEDLLAPFVGITRQCNALNAAILKPSFDGFTRLDPTLNKAICLIHAADEAIARFPQGAFPIAVARPSVKESLRLLRRCRKRYGRIKTKAMEQAYHLHFRLWFYRGEPRHPADIFRKRLFESEARLVGAICDHNVHIDDAPCPAASGGPARPGRRRRAAGERDETLHAVRAQVVGAIRALRRKHGLSWAACVKRLRTNSAYVARMRGKSDATWIRYAKEQ